MGWSYDFLREKNLFWALSRLHLEIDKMPDWNDTVTIKSAPQKPDLFYAPRDFLVYDAEGEILIRAMSYWIIIDLDTRRPTPPETFFSGYEFPTDKILFAHKPKKLRKPKNSDVINNHKILYSDIDQNKHVNNSRYVEFIMDGFPPKFWQKNKIKSMLINYSKEAVYGEELSILSNKEGKLLNLTITGGDGYEKILSQITLVG